jgi:hypothetical protein
MTTQERSEMKAQLVWLGFWGADEPGNPAVSHHDASTLHQRLEAKLARGVHLISTVVASYSSARRVLVMRWDHEYPLVTADNYPEAICQAALALPEFLNDHPEYAAN